MCAAGVAVILALLASGCGFNVRSADVFLITRTGQGTRLTVLVNDGGTVSCNGAKPKPISDPDLITARDLAQNLAGDAQRNLRLGSGPGTIFTYRVSVQQGTVVFGDHDTAHHPILAQTELFTAQLAQRACNLN
ncbi:MAG TPA: hypothetical protein VFN55_13545 [Solirubrobacteraceae bacterium]|nr:hypothetical protein [Solirubrobacteraceae bacterium]